MSTTPLRALRFWHQSMTELDVLGAYRDALIRQAAVILGSDAAIEVSGVRSGTYHGRTPTAAMENAFVYHRALDQIIDNAIRAEKEGYDAFIIGSFSEPYLREIRSAVRIPVASLLESSMLVACSLGKKIVPLSNAPQIAFLVQNAVEKHGLQQRIMPAVALEPAWHEPELAAAFTQPQPLLDAFAATARARLAQGADVIVPAEGVMASVLSANQIRDIDGAPVLDVFALTWRYAVMLARLREQAGMQVSDVGHYARGEQALIDLMVR